MLRRYQCRFALLCTTVLLAIFAVGQAANIPAPPPTPKHPVTDIYHGVKVTEDYRWLEDWNDPEVKQWSAAQNARTREYLDHLPIAAGHQAAPAQLMTRHLRPLLRGEIFAVELFLR